MSFSSIATCVDDEALAARTAAAYAKEQDLEQPEAAWNAKRWLIAADPSIEAPYESALASENPDPGGDPSVISDGMLTAAVAAHPYEPLTPTSPPPPLRETP